MLPKAEIKGYDPEVQNEYDALTSRRGELRDELSAVNGEKNKILANLGELVYLGSKYAKHTDRLAKLRQQVEAVESGILFVDNQRGLLERMNTWLRSR